MVALVLFMHGAAIRFWNYALYCGAIAAGVLILVDLPQPSNYGAEGYRVLWTLCGVGIGVLVMLLAGLLAKRTAKAPPQPAHNQPERVPLRLEVAAGRRNCTARVGIRDPRDSTHPWEGQPPNAVPVVRRPVIEVGRMRIQCAASAARPHDCKPRSLSRRISVSDSTSSA